MPVIDETHYDDYIIQWYEKSFRIVDNDEKGITPIIFLKTKMDEDVRRGIENFAESMYNHGIAVQQYEILESLGINKEGLK